MRILLRLLVIVAILCAIGAASYNPVRKYWKKRTLPDWKLAEVQEGDLVSVVNATGEVKPVRSVQIGSFVSGPIIEIKVDFNDEVQKDQLLAKVDPRLFEATVRQNKAALRTRQAEVDRVKAQLQQATNDEARALSLREDNEDFISDTEIDQYVYAALSLKAQLELAEAAVEQAQAALENAEANLRYTDITSPIDGVVIDRKIDPGQTLAAQFQTPELFVVAPDMEKKMHVFASVDEADIGQIMKAKEQKQRVQFSVDAWPEKVFDGEIEQIRVSSTTVQNVVTYPVVVAAPNPERKLLPGMTANISFDVEHRNNVIKIPNAALRFFPPDRKYVRQQDHKILDGNRRADSEREDGNNQRMMTAAERAAARHGNKTRHVWVVEGDSLKAVEVQTGLMDGKFTEMTTGDLTTGQKLVAGINPKKRGR